MTSRKAVLLILDGLGDLPHAAMNGRTPLDAAHTPNLDRLAALGTCGLLDPIAPNVIAETHAGTAPLLGAQLADAARLARGPIEAAGAGIEVAAGDIAFRGNFATFTSEGADAVQITDRRAGRINADTELLAAALNELPPLEGVTFRVAAQQQHRLVMCMSGHGLSSSVTDTDPGTSGDPQTLRWSRAMVSGDGAAERTARVLNKQLRRVREVLSKHSVNATRQSQGLLPANGVITRGAGTFDSIDGLVKGLGLRGAMVSGDRTVLGLGQVLGIAPIVRKEFTGLVTSDPAAKITAAIEALSTHDVVWIHYKGTDVASHDKNPVDKRDCIERVDVALAPLLKQDVVLGVTADHTTDSSTGSHTADPVPALLHVPGGKPDAVIKFDEASCAQGALRRIRSSAYLRRVLHGAGRLPTRSL